MSHGRKGSGVVQALIVDRLLLERCDRGPAGLAFMEGDFVFVLKRSEHDTLYIKYSVLRAMNLFA